MLGRKAIKLLVVSVVCLLGLLSPLVAEAQSDGCHTKLTGSDKSDFDKGVEAYNNKRYQQCITLMRRVSQHNRTAADPYFYMGVAAVKAGERPAVVKSHFSRLFKLCPDYPNALAYYYMGVVHYTYDEYAEAAEQLQRYFDIANQQPNPAYDVVYEEASAYLYWSEFLAEAQQNQVPFFPAVVRGVSSKSDEYLPYFSPDGQEVYYLRKVPRAAGTTFYSRDNDGKVLRLFSSQWKDTAYSQGTLLPAPFNEEGDQGSVSVTADNKTLYLSILSREKGYDNCDIWYSCRENGVWQPLQNAGRNVNGERTWESQPSLTPDGQYLYFASNRPGGLGGTDIWRCRRLPNGDWSRAENLGPAVNTAGDEKCPFIHADGKTLYFASNGWQGFGGFDMYFINITDTYLQRPTNLGLPINTEGDDICFGVTADGKRGYFAGKSTEWHGVGGTDVFTFELYPAAQPEEMAVVTASLRSVDGRPLGGSATVLRQKAEADRYIVGDDGRLALALAVRSKNTVVVSAEGFMPFVCNGTAAQLQRDLASGGLSMLPLKLLDRYPLPLPSGQSGRVAPLSSEAAAILDAYADFLLEHPRMRIRIEATYAEDAQAIHDYLLSRQLRAERLSYKQISALAMPQIVITEM